MSPTFALIPGSLHSPVHFSALREALAEQGHESVAVRLPNIGEGASAAQGNDDARVVRSVLEELVLQKGLEVVCVCHSYGGIPGSQAVKGLEKTTIAAQGREGGIVSVVFLCAIVAKEGLTVLDALQKTQQPLAQWMEPDPEDRNLVRPNALAKSVMYHDLDDPLATQMALELLPMNVNHLTTPTKDTCWSSDVPILYVLATKDQVLLPKSQQILIDEIPRKESQWDIVELACGHSPSLSHIGDLIDIITAHLTRIAGKS